MHFSGVAVQMGITLDGSHITMQVKVRCTIPTEKTAKAINFIGR